MLKIRRANDRGHSDIGWLDSHHSFSFADYYDSKHMGFGLLRVVNDDIVAPGGGFGTHPHRDMEIISYVLDGELRHKDSMGNGSVIRPGDLQRMSAGTGVTHSEFNNSESEPVRFLQIWFLPDRAGHNPGYEQKFYSAADKRGRFKLLASANGDNDSVSLNQDVNFFAGLFDQDEQAQFEIDENRDVWVQIAGGSIKINGEDLQQGDGIAITQAGKLNFTNGNNAEVVIFDMTRRT
jgi:redox-sensitive bicupin YhaK (pirin superfamily)